MYQKLTPTLSLSMLFPEPQCLTDSGTHWFARLADQKPLKFFSRWFLVLDYRCRLPDLAFSCEIWGTNSGFCACKASTLLTASYLPSYCVWFCTIQRNAATDISRPTSGGLGVTSVNHNASYPKYYTLKRQT